MSTRPSAGAGDSGRTHLAVWLIAALTFLFHLATARGYGYFRDELYYLANGEHLSFGYVEHPPFIGLVAAFVRATLGESLVALRLLPALAGALTVWLAGSMARELGGRSFAQAIASLTMLVVPASLSLFTLLTMNAFDVLWWALAWWLAIRILRSGDQRLWLAFGVVAGLGLQTKISMLFLGGGLVAGLVLSRQWAALRSGWFWLGGVVAALMFAPFVWWQAWHGWPLLEFMDNARRYKNVGFSPVAFMAAQAMQVAGPSGTPVFVAGLIHLLFARSARPFRALGVAYLAIVGIMLGAGNAKPYYLAASYSMLFAAGGVAIEGWTSGRLGSAARVVLVAWVLGTGVLIAPFAKPLLPVDAYVRYAAALGVQPGTEERHEMGRLSQFFADMHGWPELAETLAGVFRTLSPAEQARACIFAQNYGEAGAIDLFGPRLGLPHAISGHNSYFIWGPRGCTGEIIIVIGETREALEAQFAHVDQATTFVCTDCMPYENNKPIWIARQLRAPLTDVWPRVKSYI